MSARHPPVCAPGSVLDQDLLDPAVQIGLTIGQPDGVGPHQTSRQQQLEMVGEALGRSPGAADLKAEVEQDFADAAAAHPKFDGTEVAVGAYTSEGFGAYVRGDARVDFMEQLGFVNQPAIQELDEAAAEEEQGTILRRGR